MAASIDERIVKLTFNNHGFASKIKTTITVLNALKSSLNMDKSIKGINSLGSVFKSLPFNFLSSNVEKISSRFSNLGIIGVTALQNIANSAVNAGKTLVSALTIKPIKMGFQEYETQINAVQTILANTQSKGTNLQQVSAALDELNHYADKTIYNFTEMTRNIGTFTAAGVDLDTSVAAIKGIANLAAVSGSNSMQASSAMYQLSQALAAGTVKLIDWNSVVNAGMGGQVFQDALKETARVHGIAIDDMIEKEGSFRETLQHGWLSSEILTETLSKFTGDLTEEQLKQMGYTDEQIAGIIKMGETANDAATKVKTFTQLFSTLSEAMQSGWTQSWEIVIGDFEEAKELLTSVSDVLSELINNSAKSRNAILQDWKDLGGRAAIIQGISNIFQGLVVWGTKIGEAFRNIFPPITGNQLADFSKGFENLTEGIKNSEQVAEYFAGALSGVFSAAKLVKDAFFAMGQAFSKVFSDSGNFFVWAIKSLSEFGTALSSAIKNLSQGGLAINLMRKGFEGVFSLFKPITSIISGVIKVIKALIESITEDFDIQSGLMGFLIGFAKAGTSISSVISDVDEKINNFFNDLANSVRQGNGFSTFIVSIFKGLSNLSNAFKTIIGVIGEFAKAIAAGVGPAVEGFIASIKNLYSELSSIGSSPDSTFGLQTFFDAINSVLLGGSLAIIFKFVKDLKTSFSDVVESVKGFGGLSEVFDSVRESLETWQTNLKADSIKSIAIAIGILSVSLVILASIDPERLASALGAMGGAFAEMMAGLTLLQAKVDPVTMAKLAASISVMIGMSAGILILSIAMKSLASLDWNGLAKGLVGTAVAMGELIAFMNLVDFSKIGKLSGLGLIGLAAAIYILSKAVGSFAKMDIEALAKGLISVGVALGLIAAFSKVSASGGKMVASSIGLLIISGAMIVLSKAISSFGSMSVEQLAKGLIAMSVALTAIGVAASVIPVAKLIGVSTGMVIMSVAISVLASAVKSLGQMQADEIGRSLIVLGGSLLILAAALMAMKGSLAGAASLAVAATALLIMSSALAIVTPSLLAFSKLDFGQLGMMLLTLAGVFAIFGAAAYLLAPIVPSMLGLGAALTLLGVACFAAGAGIALLGVGLMALATVGSSGIAILVAAATALIELLPVLFQAIGLGMITMVETFASNTERIMAAITTLISTLIEAIMVNVPLIVNAGLQLLLAILQGIRDNIYNITVIVGEIIVQFLTALAEQLPIIIDAGFNLIISFINGLSQAIQSNGPAFCDALKNLFITAITTVVTWIGSQVGTFLTSGREIITNFISGIAEKIGDIKTKISDGIRNAIDSIGSFVSDFFNAGKNIVQGMIDGIGSAIGGLANKAAEMARSALNSAKDALGIESPSKAFIIVGKFVDEGFAKGITMYEQYVDKASSSMGNSVIDNVKTAMSSISDVEPYLGKSYTTNATITPVIDSKEARKRAEALNSVLGNKSFEISAKVNADFKSSNDALYDRISQLQNATDESNNRVVTAIDDLRTSLNEMPEEEIALYVDSKKLASTTAKAMNRELGAIARRGGIA